MKHRVVLAGCGGISRAWIKAMKEFDDVELVGMVDISPEAIEAKIAEFSLSPKATGSDLAEVIGKSQADLVFDCTIPEAHFGVVTTALEQGCHVMGEKPMADTMEHARKMVETAKRTGKTYAVMQNRRYNRQIRRYRDLVGSGAIGELTTLNADFYIGAHFGGFRDAMQHVLILDMAIHSFDEARYISGADPVSVYCHEWNPKGSWYTHGASAVCIFEMTGGLIFTYRGSWCSEGLNTSWECEWRAVGTVGSAAWDGNETITAEKAAGAEGFKRPLEAVAPPEAKAIKGEGGHTAAIRDYLDALEAGKTPLTVGSDNIKSVAMVQAAIASAECGARVTVE
jgi:predicted dehydrogenase